MFLAINGIGDLVKIPFGYLLSFLYDLTTNYGVALILFAILVRFILLPATAKAKKSTMKMSRLQPRIQAIQSNMRAIIKPSLPHCRSCTKKRAFPWAVAACGACCLC